MILQDILYGVRIKAVSGATSVNVTALHIDSRLVSEGQAFIAIRGTQVDGHEFIGAAIAKGASVIICEEMPTALQTEVVYVQIENAQAAVGLMASNFFHHPSQHLKMIGVTGTNGKTTIATLLYNLFTQLGETCGLLSTVENVIAGEVIPATHTTPDAIQLQSLLQKMVAKGCTHVFMEVSSHAIHQHRIAGVEFLGAIFSNITHDHLDYHKTFDAYIDAKKSWFDHLPKSAFAISNADDKRGAVMLQNTAAKKVMYGLKSMVDVKGKILDNSLLGLHLLVDEREVHFRLIGEFNAYNLLAVYAAAIQMGYEKDVVLLALSVVNGAEGRFDYSVSDIEKVIGIVDYAHTPDALENVLQTIQKLRKGNEKVISVVGCGGNRDKAKRPLMTEVACSLSDHVILTADNPRNEEVQDIINDMYAGVNAVTKRKVLSITDRKEAIRTALTLARNNDIVLVAGKGHEKYQEINGVKYPFDDKKILQELFNELGK